MTNADKQIPLTTEELARRMLSMPCKPRAEMVKKKAKPPAKKK